MYRLVGITGNIGIAGISGRGLIKMKRSHHTLPRIRLNPQCNHSDIKKLVTLDHPEFNEERLTTDLTNHKKGEYQTLRIYEPIRESLESYQKNKREFQLIDDLIIEMNQGNPLISIEGRSGEQLDLSESLANLNRELKSLSLSLSPWNYNYKNLEIISRICEYLCDRITPIINIDKIDQWFSNQWIYSPRKKDRDWLDPFINDWFHGNKGKFNAFPIKELLITMCKYKNFVTYLHIKELNRLGTTLNHKNQQLAVLSKKLKYYTYYEDIVMKYGFDKLCQLIFPVYDFKAIEEDDESYNTTQILHKAVQEIPGAVQWIIIDGSEHSKSDMLRHIIDHTLEKSLDINILEFNQGLRDLKQIYTNGWDFWIRKILVQKGIGIQKLSFDDGVDLKDEDTCIYWLKHWIDQWICKNMNKWQEITTDITISKFFMHRDLIKSECDNLSKKTYDVIKLCELCNKNDFDKLLQIVLSNFGEQMKSRDYFDMLKITHENKNHALSVSYSKFWQTNYPDDHSIDCSNIDKVQFVRKLWEKLPYPKNSIMLNAPPSDTDIKNALNEKNGISYLCGKNLHGGCFCWNSISTFNFDLEMGFGETKAIYNSLIK